MPNALRRVPSYLPFAEYVNPIIDYLTGNRNGGILDITDDAGQDIGVDGTVLASGQYAVSIGSGIAKALHLDGQMRVGNTFGVTSSNAAGSADIALIKATAGDVIETGQTGTRNNLLGTVVAPAVDPPTVNGQVTAEGQTSGWISLNGATGAVQGSYNATGSRPGVGSFSVTWDRDFTGAEYCIIATCRSAAGGLIVNVISQAAGSCSIDVRTAGGVATDPTRLYVAAWGTLV